MTVQYAVVLVLAVVMVLVLADALTEVVVKIRRSRAARRRAQIPDDPSWSTIQRAGIPDGSWQR